MLGAKRGDDEVGWCLSQDGGTLSCQNTPNVEMLV